MRGVRKQASTIGAIAGLVAIALAVGGYILVHQRLALPWQSSYTVRAAFPTGQAVTPGQGQQVTVAGVKVGEVSAVDLDDGHAVVSLRIERDRLDKVGTDARLLLRPKTPLQDMSVDLDPGRPSSPSIGDRVIPVAQTRANVNVDEVLSGLDSDTRSYLRVMMASMGQGLDGRGLDLRRLLQATTPGARELARLDDTLAGRRADLRDLVSRLRGLTGALAGQRASLRELVRAGEATFGAIGAEQEPLRAALAALPGTLARAEGVLDVIRPFSRTLTRSAKDLVPVAERLEPTLRRLQPFLRDAAPAVAQLRALTPEAQPLAEHLRSSLRRLRPATPRLAGALRTTRHAFNELAHVPAAPDKSYLFWLAWFSHNANSMLSTQDANGATWRAAVVVACSNLEPLPKAVDVLSPLYAARGVCPKSE
jgi:virulence factor Mce-like protein